MKSTIKVRVRALVALSCLLVAASVAAAAFAPKQITRAFAMVGATRPLVKVALTGVVEREKASIAVEKVSAVNPGEILSWTITSQNEGDATARDYKTVGQISRGTVFVAGSAQTEQTAEVTYSIDGGKTFQSQPVIEEKQPDGTVKRVAAPVSLYTQVRYEWADGLAAGGKQTASYKVRVK